MKFLPLKLRWAETEEEREAIYRLRYRIYVEEMNRTQKYADHKGKRIEEPMDRGAHLLGAFDGERVVATLRVNLPGESDIGYYAELYSMERFRPFFPNHTAMTTKLMVDPEYRRTSVSIQLGVECFIRMTGRGVIYDFIDCNDYLTPYFERLGYRQLFPDIVHPEYGQVVPMVLATRDVEYLKSIRSPLAAPAAELQDVNNSVAFFHQLLSSCAGEPVLA